MAIIVGRRARKMILEGTIRLGTDTIKSMICDTTLATTSATVFVHDGTGASPLSHETTVANYTGGFGGASRITLASKTFTEDASGDRALFKFAQIVWPALATGTGLGGVVFYFPVTTDSDSIFIAHDDCPNLTTNGLDVFYDVHVDGLLRS